MSDQWMPADDPRVVRGSELARALVMAYAEQHADDLARQIRGEAIDPARPLWMNLMDSTWEEIDRDRGVAQFLHGLMHMIGTALDVMAMQKLADDEGRVPEEDIPAAVLEMASKLVAAVAKHDEPLS